jgi:sugar phosphate isomerase/epimerase
MKHPVRLGLLSLICAGLAIASRAATSSDFREHLGLQLWSLRAQMKQNPAAALDTAKSYGITEVETAGVPPGMTAEQFAAELKSRGLKAVSAHTGYGDLEKDIGAAIRTAKTLGVKFLVCPYPKLDKNKMFTEAIAHEMAANFNKWGEACRQEGIRFGFHAHGLEFRPTADGKGETVFDILVRETKPELVSYQMDVFWVFHAGQDPAKLLQKYPNRWVSLHVKDIRKGAVTGLSTGSAPPTDNVTVGTGQINWPEVLRTAQKIGVQHYFIEDETPTPLQCIPDSLKYLRGLKL